MRRALVAALAGAILLVASLPVHAANTYVLPETVRINIGLGGLTQAVISATGPFLVTAPEGKTVFRDAGRLAVRTNVLRLDGDIAIPRGYVPVEERPTRLALIREARLAEAISPKSLVRIPFELEQLASVSTLDTGIGPSIFRASSIIGLKFAPLDQGTLTLNGKGYRGTFEVAPYGQDFTVINTVATDRYLVSVVGSEIPQDWHREAQAAQVIAARTYLIRHLGSHGSYDLDGDERDQEHDPQHRQQEGHQPDADVGPVQLEQLGDLLPLTHVVGDDQQDRRQHGQWDVLGQGGGEQEYREQGERVDHPGHGCAGAGADVGGCACDRPGCRDAAHQR